MYGACITAQYVGINNRLRALSALVKVRGGSEKTIRAIRKFAGSSELNALQQKRHRTVHDPRLVHKTTETIERLQITADHSLVFGFQPEDIDELEAVRRAITAQVWKFKELYEKVAAELASLPEKDRPLLHRLVPVKKDKSTPTTAPKERQRPPESSDA